MTKDNKPLTCMICNTRVANRKALHVHFLENHPIG